MGSFGTMRAKGSHGGKARGARRWLGIFCRQCNLYQRIYIHDSDKYYKGRCLRCRREIIVLIDRRRGTPARFFELV